MLSWQNADGSLQQKGDEGREDGLGYSTAIGVLVLAVPDSRLSIFNRDPPKLPPAK